MARTGLAVLAFASIAAMNQSARADALWFDPPLTTSLTQGQWFASAGALGGTYRPPRWRSVLERYSGTQNLGPNDFSTRTFMIGPGGTLGYRFGDGTFPAWLGTNVRLAFSGMWWSGRSDSAKTHDFLATDTISVTAVDGRVGAAAGSPLGAAFRLNETLRTEFNAYELGLRLTADHPLTPRVTFIPSIGIFGGSARERYRGDFNVTIPGTSIVALPGRIDERITSDRVGADLGLGLAWQATPIFRFGIGARAGFHWIRSRLDASDCVLGGVVTAVCSVEPGTFIGNTAWSTSASDRRSTVGFRGSIGTSMTLDGGWIQAQLGGFFTFDSAAPGVVNPVAGSAPIGTNVGPARIRFANGHSAGGFFVVRVPLP